MVIKLAFSLFWPLNAMTGKNRLDLLDDANLYEQIAKKEPQNARYASYNVQQKDNLE